MCVCEPQAPNKLKMQTWCLECRISLVIINTRLCFGPWPILWLGHRKYKPLLHINDYITHIIYEVSYTVKLPNKGHFGDNINSAVVSFWRFKNYRETNFGTLNCVLCREVYYTVSLSQRVHYRRFHCIHITIHHYIDRYYMLSHVGGKILLMREKLRTFKTLHALVYIKAHLLNYRRDRSDYLSSLSS